MIICSIPIQKILYNPLGELMADINSVLQVKHSKRPRSLDMWLI